MDFLFPLLLSISSNLDTLIIATFYNLKKVHITKSNVLIISIITSLATFISMYIIRIISFLFNFNFSALFGSVLLIAIGFYFIVEYIRIEKIYRGEDTSYYVENKSKYNKILEDPNTLNNLSSSTLNLRETLIISFSLAKDNIQIGFAASIIGFNISLTLFLTFIISILSIYIGKNYFSKFFAKHGTLTAGIILIIIGIYKTFV